MKKYLIIDRPSRLLLHAGHNIRIAYMLYESLTETELLPIDQSNSFFKNANKTVMTNRSFLVDNKSIVTQSTKTFPDELLSKRKLCEDKGKILTNLLEITSEWVEANNRFIFKGMETVVEIALRDCDREEQIFTADILDYSKSVGMTPLDAYDYLNTYAGHLQQKKLKALGFIHKYSAMIDKADSTVEIDRVNALMYKEWTDSFLWKFSKD